MASRRLDISSLLCDDSNAQQRPRNEQARPPPINSRVPSSSLPPSMSPTTPLDVLVQAATEERERRRTESSFATVSPAPRHFSGHQQPDYFSGHRHHDPPVYSREYEEPPLKRRRAFSNSIADLDNALQPSSSSSYSPVRSPHTSIPSPRRPVYSPDPLAGYAEQQHPQFVPTLNHFPPRSPRQPVVSDSRFTQPSPPAFIRPASVPKHSSIMDFIREERNRSPPFTLQMVGDFANYDDQLDDSPPHGPPTPRPYSYGSSARMEPPASFPSHHRSPYIDPPPVPAAHFTNRISPLSHRPPVTIKPFRPPPPANPPQFLYHQQERQPSPVYNPGTPPELIQHYHRSPSPPKVIFENDVRRPPPMVRAPSCDSDSYSPTPPSINQTPPSEREFYIRRPGRPLTPTDPQVFPDHENVENEVNSPSPVGVSSPPLPPPREEDYKNMKREEEEEEEQRHQEEEEEEELHETHVRFIPIPEKEQPRRSIEAIIHPFSEPEPPRVSVDAIINTPADQAQVPPIEASPAVAETRLPEPPLVEEPMPLPEVEPEVEPLASEALDEQDEHKSPVVEEPAYPMDTGVDAELLSLVDDTPIPVEQQVIPLDEEVQAPLRQSGTPSPNPCTTPPEIVPSVPVVVVPPEDQSMVTVKPEPTSVAKQTKKRPKEKSAASGVEKTKKQAKARPKPKTSKPKDPPTSDSPVFLPLDTPDAFPSVTSSGRVITKTKKSAANKNAGSILLAAKKRPPGLEDSRSRSTSVMPRDSVDPESLKDKVAEVEEAEDDKLYCVCKTRYDEDRVMIACDRCDEWYHTQCVDMPDIEVDLVDQFICPVCVARDPQITVHTTYKPRCLNGLSHPSPNSSSACHKPARGAFSKYCSDECGVRCVRRKMEAWGRNGGEQTQLWDSVKDAKRREGVVVREPGAVIPMPNGCKTYNHLSGGNLDPSERWEVERLRRLLNAKSEDRQVKKKELDLVLLHEKLLKCAISRAEVVKECGWDQRLCFGNDEWAEFGENVFDSYEEAQDGWSDGDQGMGEWWCKGKKKCERHGGWQHLRTDELEMYKRSLEEELDKNTAQERKLRAMIEDILDPRSNPNSKNSSFVKPAPSLVLEGGNSARSSSSKGKKKRENKA